MKRVTVRWQTTETFEQEFELPDDVDPNEWDGNEQRLVDAEGPSTSAYVGTIREIEEVK